MAAQTAALLRAKRKAEQKLKDAAAKEEELFNELAANGPAQTPLGRRSMSIASNDPDTPLVIDLSDPNARVSAYIRRNLNSTCFDFRKLSSNHPSSCTVASDFLNSEI